jgi:hypothetical protein
MGYASQICGSIKIDRDKWEVFCKNNTEFEEVWQESWDNLAKNFLHFSGRPLHERLCR